MDNDPPLRFINITYISVLSYFNVNFTLYIIEISDIIHLWPLLQGDMKVCLPEEVVFLQGKAREKYDL